MAHELNCCARGSVQAMQMASWFIGLTLRLLPGYAPASTLKRLVVEQVERDINNILGVEQIDEFILGDENCDANLLNMQNVSTIIRRAGFKHWGTVCVQPILSGVLNLSAVLLMLLRTAFRKPCWSMLTAHWTGKMRMTLSAPSMPICGNWSVLAPYSVGGRLDEELNTAETMASGVLYINYDFGRNRRLNLSACASG